VRNGRTVSLSRSLNTEREPDNPEPADHRMTMLGGREHPQGLAFAKDYIGVDYHNDSHSHLDALCHVSYDGSLYNGRPADSVSATGAAVETVEALKDGLVGRGVLLDVSRARGVSWLEPGDSVLPGDLEESEDRQGVRVEEGDILLVRTGHASRLDELGPWDTASSKAGLHPSCAEFLAERRVAALGCDGNSDTAPSVTEGIGFPIHVLALTAMGVHLLDYLHLDELARACEQAGRWDFLFVGAPLRIAGGTGSPLNPIAIL
jgi:kynurenine formamidase